jgi:hypothetical protein
MVEWELVTEDNGEQWWRGRSSFGALLDGISGLSDDYRLSVSEHDGGWFVRVCGLCDDALYLSPGPHLTADAAKMEAESWDSEASCAWDLFLHGMMKNVRPDYQSIAPRRKGWKPPQ